MKQKNKNNKTIILWGNAVNGCVKKKKREMAAKEECAKTLDCGGEARRVN